MHAVHAALRLQAIRAELTKMTGRTSVPNIWIGGKNVGGEARGFMQELEGAGPMSSACWPARIACSRARHEHMFGIGCRWGRCTLPAPSYLHLLRPAGCMLSNPNDHATCAGCNDGPGVATLQSKGELRPMLQAAGAL